MSTVAPSMRADQAAPPSPGPVPVRHGKCRCELTINGCRYTLKPARGVAPRARVFRLQKIEGERAGSVYLAGRIGGINSCSCDDMSFTQPEGGCKHIKALVALGFISGRPPKKGGRS